MRCAEHRFNHRHTADFSAYIMWDGRLIEATVKNISQQGMLLESQGLSYPADIEIKVCCIVSRKYYEVTGNIAHIKNNTIGINFHTPQTDLLKAVVMRTTKGEALILNGAITG